MPLSVHIKILFVSVFFLFLFIGYLPYNVSAGGCCYLDYAISQGVANGESAKITTAFTDPTDTYTDRTFSQLKPIKNKKASIIIEGPVNGQECHMAREITDSQGFVAAECTSTIPGEIRIKFLLEGNPGNVNERTSLLTIKFNPSNDPKPTANIIPSVHPTSLQVVTDTPVPTKISQNNLSNDLEKMQNKISLLESKVAKQEKEVTGIQMLINKLITLVSNFLPFKR